MTPQQVAQLRDNQSRARTRSETTQAGGSTVFRVRDTSALSVDVPLPPSWNRAFKTAVMPVGRGKFRANVYKSKEAKDYSKTVAGLLRPASTFARSVSLRFDGVVTMERAGCDLDDRLKVFFDALNGIAYEDDEQVMEIRVTKRVDSKTAGIVGVFTSMNVDRYGNAIQQQQLTTGEDHVQEAS